jgi:hypothetical protein
MILDFLNYTNGLPLSVSFGAWVMWKMNFLDIRNINDKEGLQ